MGTYARAVGAPKLSARPYWLNNSEYEKAKKFASKEGNNFVLTPPEEVIKEKEKCEVVYHTQAVSTGRVEKISIEEIEECLKSVMQKAVMIERGSKFGTVVVTFESEEDASLYATTVLRTERIIMAPSYKGKRSTKIRIGSVPVKINVEWVLACLFKDEEVEIEEVGITPALNWWGFGIECWVNVTPEQIERLPYEIFIKGCKRLNVIVYGRAPVCYFCKTSGHLQSCCPEKGKSTEESVLVAETDKVESEEEKNTESDEFITPKKRKRMDKKKTSEQELKPKTAVKESESKKEEDGTKKNDTEEKSLIDINKKEITKSKNTGDKEAVEKQQTMKKNKETKRKNEKKMENPDEWIVLADRFLDPFPEAVEDMCDNGVMRCVMVADIGVRMLLMTTRRDYAKYRLDRYFESEDILAVLVAGQEVKRDIELCDIKNMDGDFTEEFLQIWREDAM